MCFAKIIKRMWQKCTVADDGGLNRRVPPSNVC